MLVEINLRAFEIRKLFNLAKCDIFSFDNISSREGKVQKEIIKTCFIHVTPHLCVSTPLHTIFLLSFSLPKKCVSFELALRVAGVLFLFFVLQYV